MEKESFLIQKSWKGPWLIEKESIKELDKIISEQWEKLETRRILLLKQDLKELENLSRTTSNSNEIQKRMRRYGGRSIFEITYKNIDIILSEDHIRSYPCESFDNAFREIRLIHEIPLGFVVSLTSGDIDCRIFVDSNTSTLDISASPNNLGEVRELFTVLHDWAEKHTATFIQSFFNWMSNKKWYLLTLYSAFLFISFVLFQDETVNTLRKRAEDLLASGITQSNIIEAVEILLKIQTQTTTLQSIQIPRWFWLGISGLIYLILLIFFQPKVIIGIGKGIKSIKRWNWWQRLAMITIPLFIIGIILTFFGERYLQFLFP